MSVVLAPRGGGRRVRNSNHPQLHNKFRQVGMDYLRLFSRKRDKEKKKHNEIKTWLKC